ncbi:hypothetical protein OAI23_02695 [Alphaproteobacteria bacterium]|nr:hypothetical protein [Alphaproteobacteria bacterium]
MSHSTSKDAADQLSPAHFVPLADIMQSYDGALLRYMRDTTASDVVVTMPISVEIANKDVQKFFVTVAVTTQFDTPEPLSDEAHRITPKHHQTVFAWVPVDFYGTDDFGIYIDDIAIGETLKNGLVGEVIDKAAIEAAVIALADAC